MTPGVSNRPVVTGHAYRAPTIKLAAAPPCEESLKILIVNPNTSEEMAHAIHATAAEYARPTTEVRTVCATAGPSSIEGHYDEATSVLGTLERILESCQGGVRPPTEPEPDAFVIACFSNHPAINAARELTAKPVLGIAESSMLLGCLLGHRFSVVTTSPRWKPMLEDAVRAFGLESRCASVRSSGLAVLDLDALPREQVVRALVHEGREAIDQDGAEVICLGCAGMGGLDKHLEAELGVPVLDSVVSAVKLAELLVDCGLKTSQINTFRPVDPRGTVNLPPLLESPYRRNDRQATTVARQSLSREEG